MKKYDFKVDSSKKVFTIVGGGMFSLEDAQNFMAEYRANVAKINPQDYVLIVDAKDVKVNSPEVIPLLEEMIGLYASTPFKKKFSVVIESSIAQNQVKRVGKDTLTSTFIFVTSYEDALKQI